MFKHEQLCTVVHRRCAEKQNKGMKRRTRHKQRRENFVLVWQHGCSANRVADMMMLTWWVTPSSVSFGCYPSYCQFGVEYQIDSREKKQNQGTQQNLLFSLARSSSQVWSSHGGRSTRPYSTCVVCWHSLGTNKAPHQQHGHHYIYTPRQTL